MIIDKSQCISIDKVIVGRLRVWMQKSDSDSLEPGIFLHHAVAYAAYIRYEHVDVIGSRSFYELRTVSQPQALLALSQIALAITPVRPQRARKRLGLGVQISMQRLASKRVIGQTFGDARDSPVLARLVGESVHGLNCEEILRMTGCWFAHGAGLVFRDYLVEGNGCMNAARKGSSYSQPLRVADHTVTLSS